MGVEYYKSRLLETERSLQKIFLTSLTNEPSNRDYIVKLLTEIVALRRLIAEF
jgi:hypothetical protein